MWRQMPPDRPSLAEQAGGAGCLSPVSRKLLLGLSSDGCRMKSIDCQDVQRLQILLPLGGRSLHRGASRKGRSCPLWTQPVVPSEPRRVSGNEAEGAQQKGRCPTVLRSSQLEESLLGPAAPGQQPTLSTPVLSQATAPPRPGRAAALPGSARPFCGCRHCCLGPSLGPPGCRAPEVMGLHSLGRSALTASPRGSQGDADSGKAPPATAKFLPLNFFSADLETFSEPQCK